MTEHVCLIPTHLDSHSVYFSLCVPSHLLFHHILHHLLLSASPVFSLKPIPVIPPPPLPPMSYMWSAQPKCHKQNMIPV